MTVITNRRGRGLWRFVATTALAVGLAGCDDLVEYSERDVIPPDALGGAAGAQAIYAGAIRDFGQAFAGNNGGTEGLALTYGLMSDEFFSGDTFGTRMDYDQRNTALDNSTLLGTFRAIQTARLGAHRAIDAITAVGATTEADDPRFGAMYNRIGMMFLLTAQGYCSGIPFSSVTGGVVNPGLQLTTQEMLDSADFYFDRALAANAGTGAINHTIATFMKARILMYRDPADYAGAAALVAGIPTSFRGLQEHSTANGNNENGIYVFNTQNERWTIAHQEGTNGLGFRSLDGTGAGVDPLLADPRVPWKRDPDPAATGGLDMAFDNVTPQYDLLIYTARDNPSAFVKGEEARLIEAEALLDADDFAGWLAKLNELRAGVTGLAPLADPGTADGRVTLMFRERAFWLFATGNRLGDMRRMIRQYGRTAETVFPTGTHHKGPEYGTDVNFPVPDQEKQNPNYSDGISCIDRNA
jgi:hypothetical protein